MKKELTLAIGDSWHPRALPYLAMILMAMMLITNVLNLKFINFFGLSIIGSEIIYVFSLILSDIMTEVYGYRRVRRLLWAGLSCLVLYAVFVQAVVLLAPAHGYTSNAAFVTVFAQAPRIVVASIAAYFVTELANSLVMSRMKVRFRSKYFYARALGSTMVAQAANGVVFFGIAFTGVMPLNLIVSACVFSWVAVIVCETLILPITKRLAYLLKHYEGVEHYDQAPQSN
ncbi:MAG: queuosine precursor transporter [Patescibacteria group bacterium]